MNDYIFFRLDQHVMSCSVVALVIWLYFMRTINYYALKVEKQLKLRGRIERAVQWGGDARGWRYPIFPWKRCTVNPPVAVW